MLKQRRNRVPVSCSECRKRKLKCDRCHPCSNCVSRKNASLCTFAHVESPRAPRRTSSQQTNSPSVQGSGIPFNELATLTAPDADASSLSPRRSVSPSVSVSDAAGPTWISTLKQLGSFGVLREASQTARQKASELQLALKVELLAAAPPQEVSDFLVEHFFECYIPSVPARHVLHRPTFENQYRLYGEDPESVSIAWLALFFAVLRLGIEMYHHADFGHGQSLSDAEHTSLDFKARTEQCIAAVPSEECAYPIVEARVLHGLGEYYEHRDAQLSIWTSLGTTIRFAQSMGYHRDAANRIDLTPFEGEMRRRVMAFIYQTDLLYSFQLGLPSMLHSSEVRCKPFRNLMDDEINEAMLQLPPSRPIEEKTSVSYQAAELRLFKVFGSILEHLSQDTEGKWSHVARLDQALEAAYHTIPPYLRLERLTREKSEAPAVLMQGYHLEFIFHKARCALHKPHMKQSRSNNRYLLSRKRCIDSSLLLLQHQKTLHEVRDQPAFRLGLKWYDFSFTVHDFLLAAMVLCVDLHYSVQQASTDRDELASQKMKIEALETANSIWKDTEPFSPDAVKATIVISSLLEKLMADGLGQMDGSEAMMMSLPPASPPTNQRQADTIPAQATFQVKGLTGSQAYNPLAVLGEASSGDMQPDVADLLDIDWAFWDDYVNNAHASSDMII